MRLSARFMILVVLLSAACLGAQNTQTPPLNPLRAQEQFNIAMYQRIFPRVCFVNVYSTDAKDKGRLLGHGTGFVMATEAGKTYIVTAGHVVLFAPNIEFKVRFSNGESIPATLVKCSEKYDVAFLNLPVGTLIPSGLTLAKVNPVIGSMVWLVGDPLYYENLYAVGMVSGYNPPNDIAGYMNISAGVIYGNSGGAVIDHDGNVVGIVVRIAVKGPNAFPHIGECVTVRQIRASLP